MPERVCTNQAYLAGARLGGPTVNESDYVAGNRSRRCTPAAMIALNRRMRVNALAFAAIAVLAWRPATCAAQLLPSGPITSLGGRLTFSADGSISYGSDDPGHFNYSSYDTSLTRQVRVDAVVSFRVTDYLSLLADLRLLGPIGTGTWTFGPYALFARIRPWTGHDLDVQAGLIPPVFGAFSRRAYGTDNPLIGYPLAYQYLTSLRSDVPLTAEALVAMRGVGWTSAYVSGQPGTAGVPLIDGLSYPAGVEVRFGNRPVEVSGAVTTGSLSVPRPTGSHMGSQVSARVAVRPTAGLVLGASISRGHYLYASNVDYGGADTQGAIGFDAEYSMAHWILRAEGLVTRWQLPYLAWPVKGYSTSGPISAFGIDAEARYRIRPGFYAAVRAGRLDFSEVAVTYATAPWDAPVRRVEAGVGYSVARNTTVKAAYQWNWRDTIDYRTEGLALIQLHIGF